MSLKNFHLVFVTISSLLFAFLAVWSFVTSPEQSTLVKVLGGVGIAGVAVMLTYGVYFYRKIQKLHI